MAKWVYEETGEGLNGLYVTCGACGEEAPTESYSDNYSVFPYCPWCGAKMEDWYETQAVLDRLYEDYVKVRAQKIQEELDRFVTEKEGQAI